MFSIKMYILRMGWMLIYRENNSLPWASKCPFADLHFTFAFNRLTNDESNRTNIRTTISAVSDPSQFSKKNRSRIEEMPQQAPRAPK